ncbi:Imm32 family immunity protein [Lysobacter sp. CA199]|uniref:Imm32 family immunity protein n=1 Tax=Lysobacter sp. CA199 TaxID=3455608 RepID=UPI003F8D0710
MKIRGYSVESDEAEEARHVDLAEINLWANPAELRRIAAFLANAADAMDRMGATYDHEHLSDRQRGFDDSPHFVVMRAK